jgi:hypothetical protein
MRLGGFAFMLVCAVATPPAGAQTPERGGTASGYYVSENGTRIELRHARAVLVDEAEDGRPDERQFHVLLTEAPAPPDALDRRGGGTASQLAERGELRGILLDFVPGDAGRVSVVELERPRDQFGSYRRELTDPNNVWRRFSSTSDRVAGEIASRADPNVQRPEAEFGFDAALAYDPVVRILTGAEARDSEFVRTGVGMYQAVLGGDPAAAGRLTTREVAARIASAAPLTAAERQFLQAIVEALRSPLRIVVRQRSAAIVVGDETSRMSFGFVVEDGQWRVAD